MKKYFCLSGFLMLLYSCDSNTYESIEEPIVITGRVTYEKNIKSIIDGNCIVCHSAGGLASFRPFNTYAQIKEGVQETNLLDRIQRQNGESGQMPKTGRMPQEKINAILKWSADGLLEN
jgi:mono/diheme cytochrome c family protein